MQVQQEENKEEEEQPVDVNPDVTLETKQLIPPSALEDKAAVDDTEAKSNQDKIAPSTFKVAPMTESIGKKKDAQSNASGLSLNTFKLPFGNGKKDYLEGGWYESCSELPINFDEIKADKATFFDDQQEKLTPAENMQSYIDNYSVNFKIPAYYVRDAKFFPQDPTHMIQLSTYECVTDSDQCVVEHKMDGSVNKSSFAKIHEDYDVRGLVLRLLVRVHTTLKFIAEKQFDERQGFIELHKDGDLFAMYFGTEHRIKIISIAEGEHGNFIHKFDNFGSNDGDIEFVGGKDPENDISFIRKMKFDVNKRYLVGWGDNKIFILNLATQKHKIIQNNNRLYNKICDLNFTSRSDDDKDYTCYLSCARKGIKQISNFNLMEDLELRALHGTPYHGQNLKSNCTINYLNDLEPDFKAKISSDDQQIVFANGRENYILKTMGSYHEQKKIKQIKTREIRAIIEDYETGGFYFFIHKDYDKFVNVEHSNRLNMDVRFPKRIETGILKFFDVNITRSKEKDGSEGNTPMEVRMITQLGDEFQLDKATYDEVYAHVTIDNSLNKMDPVQITQREQKYFNYIFSPLRAASTSWPFFAISAIGNAILIINAYDPKKIQRVQIADDEEKITICQTFITRTNDLYVATQENQLFKLYTLDLDLINKYDTGQDQSHLQFEKIFQYEDTEVKQESLKQLHIRGSSRKQLFDMNEKLQVFFLHGKTVYSWIQLNDEQPLIEVCQSTSKLTSMGDNCFYLQHVEKDPMTKKKIIKKQTIYRVDILFSSYYVNKVYSEVNMRDKMKTFLVDQTNNKLFIMFKTKNTAGYVDHILKILELASTNMIQELILEQEEIVGRLKSDMFTFKDGFIYYNNTVIKIRYDLIDKKDSLLTSDQVFDKYPSIFKINENQSIMFGTPLESLQSHRFTYIITDNTQTQCNTVRVMPFCHERRIYLNKQQVNTEYFYTAVETPRNLIDAYNKNVVLPITQREGTDIKINSRIDRTPKKFDELQEYRKNPAPTTTSIICFDLLRASFDVYSQNGQLINQVDYSQLQRDFGVPNKISSNGTNVVFKQTLEQLEDKEIQNASTADLKQEFMSVHLVQTSIFGLQKVKTIDLLSEIKALQQKSQGGLNQQIPESDIEWLYATDLNYKQMVELIDFAFEVSDELEVCIRIAPSKKYKEEMKEKGIDVKTIFYYEDMFDKRQMYLSVQKDDVKFAMTSDHLIFYDTESIKFFFLDSDFKESNKKDAGFSLSKKDPPVIRNIRTTNQSHIVIIVITQNPNSMEDKVQDTVIIWNMDQKNEIDSFDLDEEYIIIQDAIGNPYIITATKTHMVMQFCAACVYDCIQPLYKAIESMKGTMTISISKGVRFDTNNHNWLILYEYLSLGYSYMTFMMRDKIQTRDSCLEGNEFDLEPYNYIYNKTTCYLEGKFVTENQNRLEHILTKSAEANPDSLDQLHYTQDVMQKQSGLAIGNASIFKRSALYRAFDSGNQKCLDLIMEQMAKIEKNGSANFSHVLKESTETNGLPEYFCNLPFQNSLMKGKSIIKANGDHSEGIIAINYSPTQYVDNKFFKDKMGESPDNAAQPCKVVALRCGWLLKSDDGKEFLNNILQSGNLDHFDMKPLQLVIEFLFQKYKYIILITQFPLYIFSHVTFNMLLVQMDKYLSDLWKNNKIPTDEMTKQGLRPEDCDSTCPIDVADANSEYLNFVLIWLYLVLAAAAGQIMIMGAQIYSGGAAYFKRFYSLFDILYVLQVIFTFTLINLFLGVHSLPADQFEDLANLFRKLGIFGLACLFMKATYFLSLLDPIAPLIDIIFQIFFDIKYFVLVLFIFIFMIAQCFQLTASLQTDFDKLTEEETTDINSQYFNPKSSFWYSMQFMFGGASNEPFAYGEHKQEKFLNALHFIANFLICLHLLNMLIAIMGSTYGNREAVGSQIMKRDHLRFVMDNWILLNFAFFNQLNNLEFLIAALPLDDEEDEGVSLSNFYETFQTLVKSIDNQFGQAKLIQAETQLIVMEIKGSSRSMNRHADREGEHEN